MMMKKILILLLIAVLCCAGAALAEGGLPAYSYPGDGVDYTLWLTTAKG